MYFEIHVYMYKYDYVMGFQLMVMLCNTTGFYGRPVIEVAYEEMIFHSTKAVWKIVAREEWLGVGMMHRPCFDIPGSISVWLRI